MHQITISKKLEYPSTMVWDVINDFGNISNFHPRVEKSYICNNKQVGNGAERKCHFGKGNVTTERIIDYTPNEAYEVEIIDTGKFPLEKAFARFEVKKLDDNSSEVVFTMNYIPKLGAVGLMLSNLVMKPQFESIFTKVLTGLDTYLRTNKENGKEELIPNFV